MALLLLPVILAAASFDPGLAGAGSDATRRDPPASPPLVSLLDFLQHSPQLFEATVISHSQAQAVYEVPGHRKMLPQACEQLELLVTNVLHGGCIPERVRLRTLVDLIGPEFGPGVHVLVSGTRNEADHWTLWGDARIVDGRGLVLPRMNEPPTPGPRMLTIKDLRRFARESNGDEPDRLFRRVTHLQVSFVTGKTVLGANAADLLCSPIGAAIGTPHRGPVRLRFLGPPNGACRYVGVGDTLVIPDANREATESVEIHGCLEYFLAVRGYLPGLGVTLSEAKTAFVPGRDGYELRHAVPAAPELR